MYPSIILLREEIDKSSFLSKKYVITATINRPGIIFPTRIAIIFDIVSPIPKIRIPPAAEISWATASVTKGPMKLERSVSVP